MALTMHTQPFTILDKIHGEIFGCSHQKAIYLQCWVLPLNSTGEECTHGTLLYVVHIGQPFKVSRSASPLVPTSRRKGFVQPTLLLGEGSR